jgi:hypothetical protein
MIRHQKSGLGVFEISNLPQNSMAQGFGHAKSQRPPLIYSDPASIK